MTVNNPYKQGGINEAYTIIRFINHEVYEQLEFVVKKIFDKILFINNSKTPKIGV